MKSVIRHALTIAGLALATQAAAQISLYEQEDYQGRTFTTQGQVADFSRFGFNDRASSVVVKGSRWEVCQDIRFQGNCFVLRPGRYPTLAAMGLNDRISSVRAIGANARVSDDRYAPLPAAARITFYEAAGFEGRSFTTQRQIRNFRRFGFNDAASSVDVVGDRWEACQNANFHGRCVVLRPGRYPSLAAMGLDDRVTSVREIALNERVAEDRYAPLPVVARITFYEAAGFQGRSFTTEREIGDFRRFGFNDAASSVDVVGDRWEACEHVNFGGRCVVLRPGRYPSLAAMGLNNRVTSVRELSLNERVSEDRYAPMPVVARDGRDYRRRNLERTYEANVTSTRAVVATPEQRCWVEPGQAVQQPRSNINVPGAVIGAVLGGILGHQLGKGVATVGGAAAGGFVGANVGRAGGAQQAPQNVQRCDTVPSQVPTYYDVSYSFRGQDHRVQMAANPGSTVTVNERGEPRE